MAVEAEQSYASLANHWLDRLRRRGHVGMGRQ
jgi:hypothetical protein